MHPSFPPSETDPLLDSGQTDDDLCSAYLLKCDSSDEEDDSLSQDGPHWPFKCSCEVSETDE